MISDERNLKLSSHSKFNTAAASYWSRRKLAIVHHGLFMYLVTVMKCFQ